MKKQSIGFLALLSVLLAGSIGAQETAEKAGEATSTTDEIYFDRVDVNVVNIDVYVTDKKGNRITGLTIDDFQVFEDGRPVKVSNFYAVEDGVPVSEVGPAATIETQDDRLVRDLRLEPMSVPEDQRLHLIIYLDNNFMKPFSRNKVIRQVRRFLRTHVKPEDLTMLVTFERWLHVRHEFTRDRLAISDALDELETHTGFGVQQASDRRQVLRSIDMARTEEEALAHARSYADGVYHEMGNSIRGLREVVSSMAGLPGRKALLYVSDGLPMTAAQDIYHLLNLKYSGHVSQLEANRYSARSSFRQLTAHANANRVSFYTLEAAGLRSHGSLSAEHGGSGGGRLSGGSRIEVDVMHMSNIQEPLQLIAADTGGIAAFNTNNLDGALDNMAGDFRSYYSLGYLPKHAGEGRYHDIEVKVKKRGLKVRHRSGYRDKSAETQVNEGTLAVLMHGLGKNPLDIQLQLAKGSHQEDNKFLVPFEVRIPLGKLALLPHATIHRGNLRVSVAVIDDNGRLSPIEQTPIPIEIPDSDLDLARQKYFIYDGQLLMRSGYQKVAIGVRDEVGGESSYIRRSVEIGS